MDGLRLQGLGPLGPFRRIEREGSGEGGGGRGEGGGEGGLVHGWDRIIKNVHFYSLLGLSTHKNIKCYPTREGGGEGGGVKV